MLPQLAGLRGLFTVAAGTFAIVVFIFDTVSPREISVATLYVLVVMLAAVKAQETIRDLHRKLAHRVEQSTTELARAQARFQALYEDPNIGLVEFDLGDTRTLIDGLDGGDDIRRHLEARPEVFDALLKSMRTVDVNDTMVRMAGFGSKAEFLGGLRMFGDLDGFLKAQLEPLFRREKVARGTHFLLGANERRVPIAYAANHVEGDMSYATIFDISERQRAHELILAAQEELARANLAATVGAFSVSIRTS